MAQTAVPGDPGMKPSQLSLASPEAEAGSNLVAEFPDTRTMSVKMLRARYRRWFHHMQMESIGLHAKPEGQAYRGRRDR